VGGCDSFDLIIHILYILNFHTHLLHIYNHAYIFHTTYTPNLYIRCYGPKIVQINLSIISSIYIFLTVVCLISNNDGPLLRTAIIILSLVQNVICIKLTFLNLHWTATTIPRRLTRRLIIYSMSSGRTGAVNGIVDFFSTSRDNAFLIS